MLIAHKQYDSECNHASQDIGHEGGYNIGNLNESMMVSLYDTIAVGTNYIDGHIIF
jgi:hypothetical protein